MCDTTGGVTIVSLRNPDLSPISFKEDSSQHNSKSSKHGNNDGVQTGKQNQVGNVMLCGVAIVSLVMDGKERLCLAQISSTLLKDFSYNEIHNRRVALGITCVQCTPVQLEILRRAGAMPVTSRRCGMITRREAERLCQSFLGDHAPPQLPENFAFEVYHECGWGSRGSFVPSRYNSSRAKCIRCTYCQLFFSPNKFIFHSHRLPESRYVQPDAANFNSWRRHLKLCGDPPDDDLSSNNTLSMDTAEIVHAWEDVRAMFNGGTRKRMLAAHSSSHHHHSSRSENHTNSMGHRRGGGSGNGGKNGESGSNGGHGSGSSSRKAGSGTPQPSRQSSSHHNQSHNSHTNHIINNNPGFNTVPPTHNNSTSPNSFTSSNPLLSPSNRLENIWNPGIAPVNANGSRLGPLPGNAQMSHLPFHPLSIPWLRRPLFPFPHPFAPACHLLTDAGISVPEKIASLSGTKANHSAFKPVSRNAENFFSWLSTNNISGNPSVGEGVLVGSSALPEDLSTSNHHQPLMSSPLVGRECETQTRNSSQEHSPVSSTNNENFHQNRKEKSLNKREKANNNPRHQVQILSSAMHNESDDEETVDIEEVDEECSSTSFIWVSSTNNNNNNSISRNKRLSVDSQQQSISEHSYSGEDEKFDGKEKPLKRKRLWDFDSSENIKKGELCCDDETRTSGQFQLSKN